MSVNLYPAHKLGSGIIHADGWAEESTLNLANGNFYSLADELGLRDQMQFWCDEYKKGVTHNA